MTNQAQEAVMYEEVDAKGIKLRVSYISLRHRFKVAVSKDEVELAEEFDAMHEPKFGMDTEDGDKAIAIAEKLATQLEQQLEV